MLTNIRIIWKRYLNEAEEDRFWDMPNWQRNLRREVQFARHCKQGRFLDELAWRYQCRLERQGYLPARLNRAQRWLLAQQDPF